MSWSGPSYKQFLFSSLHFLKFSTISAIGLSIQFSNQKKKKKEESPSHSFYKCIPYFWYWGDNALSPTNWPNFAKSWSFMRMYYRINSRPGGRDHIPTAASRETPATLAWPGLPPTPSCNCSPINTTDFLTLRENQEQLLKGWKPTLYLVYMSIRAQHIVGTYKLGHFKNEWAGVHLIIL